MYQSLEIETKERVATVWMNRPRTHNAFDETLIGELTQAFETLARDAAVRVVVLAGRGKSFSAGADLDWMRRAAGYDAEGNRSDARALADMYRAIHRLPKPTIARVHGAALGGGVGLTAVCDIAVAAREASFGTTEVKLGIIPAVISPYVIEAIGARQAQRHFLTGERFDADAAHRAGLVHVVCAAEEIDRVIADLARALCANGPGALAAAKSLVRRVAGRPIDDALIADTVERIAAVRTTAEAQEGIGAFLEKRKPRWQD
jgi:methylglutaconyl-CoA hydratase